MDVMHPTSEYSFRLVAGFLEEMSRIFPDRFLHLGMDEVNWTCYNRSAAARAFILRSGRRLDDDGYKFALRHYLSRLQQHVGSLGKTAVVWQEALDKYGPGNHGAPFNANHENYSINTEMAPAAVQFWKSSAWYDAADGGRPVCGNLTDALANGHSALLSGPWYLGEETRWPTGYTADPATNKSCTYPAGRSNCTCLEESRASDPAPGRMHRSVPGGCYDVADDDPLFKRILGGEACLWGEGKNASNIHLAAWPGGLAVAERLWSAREVNDPGEATPRVRAQMDRLRARGVPVRPPADI